MGTALGVWKQILRHQLQRGAAGLKPPKEGCLKRSAEETEAAGPNEGELLASLLLCLSHCCAEQLFPCVHDLNLASREDAVLTALNAT